ncbi:DMT family transporter [Cupriavidus pauculus]|jgi:transporter family-2 protein|uniref:DMT family transporter n=1 Tax=Cupriavidus pauculus TaxID=82633 RepID=UPI001244E812|nr:DMT family transporter [Cupriavidus pauculus]KAB0603920.1 DMT family transporter [Cupriavidus pauculus]UAL03259.1 DMT family transporter [Cupriavidus pauculus]
MSASLATPLASTWIALGIAVLSGAMIPFQAGTNAMLGRGLGHPLWATVVSLAVSLAVVAPVLWAMRAPWPSVAAALHGPWWQWIGGVFGVIYITAALILAPRVGAANFIVGVVAGQMLASLLIDHFGLVGLPARPATLARAAGLGLILLGMLVMQWQPTPPAGRAAPVSLGPR